MRGGRMDLKAAIYALGESGVPPERKLEGVDTVRKLLVNIQRSPTEEKFRRINKTNATIQSRLFPECWSFLLAAGFQDAGDTLVYSMDPGPLLAEAISAADAFVRSLPGGAQSIASSSSSAPPRASASTAAPASAARPAGAGGGAAAPEGGVPPAAPASAAAKSAGAKEARQERAKQETQRAQASAMDQLAALRRQRAGQYQQQQDLALAMHLSGRDAERPFDPISALNVSRGATHSFVTCHVCGTSLRYASSTRAKAVLCPCGALLQPIHLRGQAFVPRSSSDIPVEPGEPVDGESIRPTRGPFITLQGSGGETTRLPLHSVLRMVRQQEARQQTGAQDATIEALPTRTFEGASSSGGASKEENHCQICMEDFEEGDELRTLPCFHLFHSKCVDQWLKVNSVCPTCRHKVS